MIQSIFLHSALLSPFRYPQIYHYFAFLMELRLGMDLLKPQLYKVTSLSLVEISLWEMI